MLPPRFKGKKLAEEEITALKETARLVRGDILKMTTLAACGHPGGSMSSCEAMLLLWKYASVDPGAPRDENRDRIVVSHGHTAPGAYAVLARLGFCNVDEAVATFRLLGSPFEGHVEQTVPGAEWNTGNLGQGLSAACGFALSAVILGRDYHTYCIMGDGEQQKGQIAEARRFAAKYGLDNLTALVDYNELQISGSIHTVMPQDIRKEYAADGWKVVEVEDGHDPQAMYGALRKATRTGKKPTCIIFHSTMSKGVSFMENDHQWHGKALPVDKCRQALEELGLEDDIDRLAEIRKNYRPHAVEHPGGSVPKIELGTAAYYGPGDKTDCRGAFGKTLAAVGEANRQAERPPIAVLDCDLASSERTTEFAKILPGNFFQAGIQEHHTAAMGGALSVSGVLTLWADFGVFGVDETYNQHRLNDMNHSALKLVTTHVGLDVGEDGKTHQCIDYVGVMGNFFGYRQVLPCDPNHTVHALRWGLSADGPVHIAMGRRKVPVVIDAEGKAFYGEGYRFEYGRMDVVRKGSRAAVLALGTTLGEAIEAHGILKAKGIDVTVMGVSCPKCPSREDLTAAAETGLIVTVEDHNVNTGLGARVASALMEHGLGGKTRLIRLGVDRYGGSGTPEALYRAFHIDGASIAATVEGAL
ncbi:MAG: transketolase [Planctomycetes bacterium]|nr:transketolase [Planctomycetota bacterium]